MDWKRIINIIYMCVLLSVVLFRLRLDHSVIYYILLNVLCFLSCYRHRFLKKIINDDEYPNVLQFIYRLGEGTMSGGLLLLVSLFPIIWTWQSPYRLTMLGSTNKKCPDSTDSTSSNKNITTRDKVGWMKTWIIPWN